MAGFHRRPQVILPKPQSFTIRRKSHLNRPVKSLMGPPQQNPRLRASRAGKATIATRSVEGNKVEQPVIATQPKDKRLQTGVRDSEAPESSDQAACHLRSYIRGAVLPTIEDLLYMVPPRGQRIYLNWLQVPFNPERRIDVITKFSNAALKAGIDNCMFYLSSLFTQSILIRDFSAVTRNYVYDDTDLSVTSIASTTAHPLILASESLSVPSKSHRRTPQIFAPERSSLLPITPRTLGEIASWVVELPLRTVQRAIHLSHPEAAKWRFDEVQLDSGAESWMNRDLYQVYVWRRHPTLRMETIQDSLAVIVQPPWILSWQDLQDVVDCTNLPPQTNPNTRMSLSYLFKHRVWALIHDTCQKLETQYFILTTYEGWVFGKFDALNPLGPVEGIKLEMDQYHLTLISSPAEDDLQDCWSKCSVSNVLDANQRLPNVVEGILYWVATSMKLEGSLNAESHPPETIKMEEDVDISTILHSPSTISSSHSSTTPFPRVPASSSVRHQKKPEVDSLEQPLLLAISPILFSYRAHPKTIREHFIGALNETNHEKCKILSQITVHDGRTCHEMVEYVRGRCTQWIVGLFETSFDNLVIYIIERKFTGMSVMCPMAGRGREVCDGFKHPLWFRKWGTKIDLWSNTPPVVTKSKHNTITLLFNSKEI
ncbi:hypothetical protein Clacol_003517 [Clathrus columnatus]|uniref:Uncharacterized protein n=1 Tax=Clathrus columnatus TaxID=1419009 RepID=A0AAV5ABI9_9AGAM|nr:hypothetical protein Clacol_003517 [Clathrus columnatus]